MPRSSGGESHAGISKEKRMRKGTRSCLLCRRRKIRCSGTGPNGCAECLNRGDVCVAQGVVDDDATANQRLRERVAFLESRLRALGETTDESQEQNSNNAVGALRRLLSGIDHGPTPPSEQQPAELDRAEEQVDTSQAPLMRLMNNPLFGASPESTAPNSNSDSSEQGKPGNFAARSRPDLIKDQDALLDLTSCLPSETVMSNILDNESSWWPLYRDTLGFHWGGDHPNLRSFAVGALNDGSPPAVALLLLCFAISTGDMWKYLPPVERHILNEDRYAATESGLNCLMALGLCYMSSLQPRRAWTVYRRANTLLQLNGIHLQHSSERHEMLFWQLFHADRWLSVMIGLPYMTPNHLCQLRIAPLGSLGAGTWLYRQLGVLTGRVLDCIQNAQGPTLSAAFEVEEELENVKRQVPPGYLDLAMIRAATDATEKHTRLFRVVHYHSLKAYIHLPFMLRSATEDRFEFSRKSCIDDSRTLLEAFLDIFDSDPLMVCYGTVLNFTVFTAAVVVSLGIFRFGMPQSPTYIPSPAQLDQDWRTILRIRDVFQYGASNKVAGPLCTKCHGALQGMISCAYDPVNDRVKRVVLPYFGTLVFKEDTTSTSRPLYTPVSGADANEPQESTGRPYPDWTHGQNAGISYDGPFLPENDSISWMLGLESATLPDVNAQQWQGAQPDEIDWSWMFADLPLNSGL